MCAYTVIHALVMFGVLVVCMHVFVRTHISRSVYMCVLFTQRHRRTHRHRHVQDELALVAIKFWGIFSLCISSHLCGAWVRVQSCSWYLTGSLLLSYQRVGTLRQVCVRDDTRALLPHLCVRNDTCAQRTCADTDTYVHTCTQTYTYTDMHTNLRCHAPHMRARARAHSHTWWLNPV